MVLNISYKDHTIRIFADGKRQTPGPEVIKLFSFSCSTQFSMKFSPLINVKMPTIVGILTCRVGKITF